MMDTCDIDGTTIHLAKAELPPEVMFTGREDELRLCKAAFGLTPDWRVDQQMKPLHFRLEGRPGVGKNEIVYEIARQLAKTLEIEFYSIQGHEEMTPEDLSILTVPDPDGEGLMPFRMQASPLATALYRGGLFFFDEINRVPARSLTPLASVLDRRQSLYSASSGLTIRPRDSHSAGRFRFCCALNPTVGNAGEPTLPDYIDERTLPMIRIEPPDLGSLRQILRHNLAPDESLLDSFEKWYRERILADMSARQALALVSYVMRTREGDFDLYAKHFVRPDQLRLKEAMS